MQTFVAISVALAIAGCHTATPEQGPPADPSDPAMFRGYAAVQDDLYAKFIASDTPFELSNYLGDSGNELSMLVGRPDGFGVTYDIRNAQPNAMNVLVWRMMLRPFASDLAATCPGSALVPNVEPRIALNPNAAAIAGAMCPWPAVDDTALGAAWDLVVGELAPASSRAAFVAYAKRTATLPDVWLGALLHPAFLLDQ